MGDPLIQGPSDWSFGAGNGTSNIGNEGGNKTAQSKSSGCGDERDKMIKEYSDPSYPADFTPLCSDFMASSNTRPSPNFSFAELDSSDIKRSEYPDCGHSAFFSFVWVRKYQIELW
jgi:hypothetical protein